MSRRATVAILLVGVMVLGSVAGVISTVSAHPAGPVGTAAPSPTRTPNSASSASHVSAPALSAHAATQQRVLESLRTAGVPQRAEYLPNYGGGGIVRGSVVSPITKSAPAPMGIGDFGVRNTTGTPAPYVIDSTSWEGSLTLNSADFLYLDNDGPDEFGVQLNTVLSNVTVEGNRTNVFWIQDVMFYQPSTGFLQFIDNIWNFSDPSTAEPASTFYQYNGTPQSPTFYDDLGPQFNVPLPFTVHLYTNSSLTNTSGHSYSTVRFGYDLVDGGGSQIASGIYDTVLFNSNVLTSSNPPVPRFQVNGGALTPTNFLLYDSELMIGGPGGGSTTQAYALNATMQLQYRSAGRWVLDPTAWTAGTDTGETAQGIAEYYSTVGTMVLTGGPSFVEPMWNATPGGNLGELIVLGTITPDNSFVFVSNATGPGWFYPPTAAWAPTVPGGSYEFELPPGNYSEEILLSEYQPVNYSFSGSGPHTVDIQNIVLFGDPAYGVYTPLFAWNNAELATISASGVGTSTDPYILVNNQVTDLPYLFGEVNDFLFPVFPGILISDTTAYFVIQDPPPFTVLYPPSLDRALNRNGLPDTNQLQIELFQTDHGTIWGGKEIGGWMASTLFGFPPFLPVGEVILWGATNTLVADNTFLDQGLGLVLMQGSHNTVWGNSFLNGLIYPASFPAQFGIWEFESGDLIYNNLFNTTVTAYSPSYNIYNGNVQTNLNSWNLSAAVPAGAVSVVNGFNLSGSIVGGSTVCGNWWDDYTPGQSLPYNEPISTPPFIETGGDYCPTGPSGQVSYSVDFSESGVTSSTWSVTLAGQSGSAPAGSPVSFSMPNGTWAYSVGSVAGLTAAPASGNVVVNGATRGVPVVFTAESSTSNPETFLVMFNETGLAVGTTWSVVVGSTVYSTSGSSVALTALNGSHPYTVPPVNDYSLATSTGTVIVAGGPAGATVSFVANPGWLNATVTPASAQAWVAGESVPLSAGAFNLEETPGVYSVEMLATGYAPYFNNVTVAIDVGTSLVVHLTNLSSGGTSPGGGSSGSSTTSVSGLPSDQFYGIVFGLLAVAVAIVVAALLLRRRSGGEEYTEDAPPETYTTETGPVAASGESEGDYNPNVAPQMHPWEESPPGSPPNP